MIHRKAMSLMSTAEAIAQTAAAALSQATSQQTSPTGSTVTHNADGTKTISGSVLGTDSTGTSVGVAQFVGDTTAPGKPTGVTATSKSGVVIVSWDGTLEGGVPSDFDHITVMMDDVELGCLKRAGSVTSGKHDAGTVVSITATAQDAARLEDGSLSPNVSAATDSISVTVVDESLELSRGNAKSIASINNHFWSDDSGAHVSHSDHSTDGANYLITSEGAAVCDGTDQLSVTNKDGNDIYVKASDGTLTNVAHFGAATRMGTTDGRHVSIDSDGLTLGNGTRSGMRLYSDVSASDASIASENHIAASGLLDIGVGFGSYSPDTGMKLYSGGSTRYAAINSGDVDKLGWRGNDDGDLVIVDGTTYPIGNLAYVLSVAQEVDVSAALNAAISSGYLRVDSVTAVKRFGRVYASVNIYTTSAISAGSGMNFFRLAAPFVPKAEAIVANDWFFGHIVPNGDAWIYFPRGMAYNQNTQIPLDYYVG